MRASLKKALDDYNLYLKKLGIDKIKKRKKADTSVFEDCEKANVTENKKIKINLIILFSVRNSSCDFSHQNINQILRITA